MEVNNPLMQDAVSKMDDLKKRDEFEQSKSKMIDKIMYEKGQMD